MLNKILIKLGLRKDVGAPVHNGVNPVYFTYVYEEDNWIFAWHDAAHKLGGSSEYWSQKEAETARKFWEGKKAAFEHASFVRP